MNGEKTEKGTKKVSGKITKKTAKTFLKKMMILLFWLAAWQLLSMVVHNPFLAASPAETFRSLLSEMGTLSFWRTVLASLFRISAGFGLGLFLGILAAAAGHCIPILEELMRPVVNLAKTVPVVSFVVLLLIWQGPSFLSVAVSFLMVFPGVYFSALEGLRAVDPEMLEMAEIFRLPAKTVFFSIYRPALKPFLLGSMKSCLGMAWKSGVAAEVIGLPANSIGERIYLSKIYLDTAGIFAWTAVTVCLSFLFERIILALAKRFWEFSPSCRAPVGPDEFAGGRRESVNQKDPSGEQGLAPCYGLAAGEMEKSFLEKAPLPGDSPGIPCARKQLFSGLSFALLPGEIRWLTWPSGQGKTTLLRILAGLEKPDRGSVQYGRGKLFLSMLFQEDRLCEEDSALRNVSMVTGERRRAEAVLRDLLKPELLSKKCGLLSGGEKRRVALARALAAESDILFLDEPFAGLDEETAVRAWETIQKWQGGRALLIASHILPRGAEPAGKILTER